MMTDADDLERQLADDGAARRGPTLLTVRPRRIVIYASIAAFFVVASMVIVSVLLTVELQSGVTLRLADQIGLVGVGVVFGAIILISALRPLLKVDAGGVSVRNAIGGRRVAWPLIERVSFPEGAQWAQLELADDESYSVMAIQAMDRRRAVAHMARFRELFEQYGTPRIVPPADPAGPPVTKPAGDPVDADGDIAGPVGEPPQTPRGNRPLGRLEMDDLRRSRHRRQGKRRRPSSG